MDSRPRRRSQAVNFDGTQMPTGSAEDRLCDLDACPRPSQTLVAQADGSILLVCEPCASSMAPTTPRAPARTPVPTSNPASDPASDPGSGSARRWDVDDTVEIPVVTAPLWSKELDETTVLAPTPQAALASSERSAGSAARRWVAGRAWSFWVRLILAVAFGVWGSMVMVSGPAGYDGVVTCAVGVYLLIDLVRPRYRNG